MAGDHDDAIARLDDLIDMVCGNSICFVVQACARTTRRITTADIPSRHTCIFSLESYAWKITTTREQYDRLSVRKLKCDLTRVKVSCWFHW